MVAGAIIARHHRDDGSRLRATLLWLGPGRVGLAGFAAGLGWGFAGSLLLGLGRGPTSPGIAWCWLAGALLIGAATFAAMLPVPPGLAGPGEAA